MVSCQSCHPFQPSLHQAAWCGTLTPGDFAVRRPGTTVKAAMVAALHRAGLAATVLSQNCQEWAVNTMIPTLETGGRAFCNMLQYASGCFGNIYETAPGPSSRNDYKDSRNMSLHDTWTSQILKVFIVYTWRQPCTSFCQASLFSQ